VAKRVAERLRVPYVGSRFSSADLERAEATATGPTNGRSDQLSDFLQSFSRTPNEVDASVSADAQTDTELVQRNIAEVLDRVKGSGGVIVGRDATVVLSGMRGAVHVRLQAPAPTRVARAAEAFGVSREEAARRQQREDHVRSRMSQRLMHWDPADASRYDLVIDTADASLDEAVEMIVAASRTKRDT
jgi:glucuronide carrier protein